MAAFLARRLIQGFVVVVLVATIVFFLIHAAPGDPFSSAMDNPAVTDSVRAAWRHAYGLDRPLAEQYVRYLASVFRGELGLSTSRRPVADAIADALPNTLLLMTVGLAAGFGLGILTAIAQARRVGTRADRILGGISLAFYSLPDFWFAQLMLVTFALWLNIFPTGGSIEVTSYDLLSPAGKFSDRLEHLILPALTLALLYFPIIARHQRAALLDTLPAEFVVTARAKGVSESSVVRRHALRNALLPVVTLLGVAFPALFTGAVFVEKVFSWPGMGTLIVNAISGRDYLLLTSAVIFSSAFVVMGSIAADVLYRMLDPRLRSDH
ncbi:MAG TPA: ABC transporter permease [Gemmatimonadaceae bacterium]|nr:ABC transporter permease [Gemmatimonadaceae bacterium]